MLTQTDILDMPDAEIESRILQLGEQLLNSADPGKRADHRLLVLERVHREQHTQDGYHPEAPRAAAPMPDRDAALRERLFELQIKKAQYGISADPSVNIEIKRITAELTRRRS